MHHLSIPAIVLLVIAGLLIVPFQLSLNLRKEGFCIFGFYRVKFLGFTIHKADLLRPEKVKVKVKGEADLRVDIKDKAVDEAPGPDSFRFQKNLRMLIDIFPAFYRFLKNLISSIHIEQLSCSISFGLNDPSGTAVISGYLWALIAMLPAPRTYIHIYPFFEGEKLDGCINTEVSARLLWVFVASINALREKPIRRLLKELLKDKMMSRKRPQMEWPLRDPRGKGNGNAIEL